MNRVRGENGRPNPHPESVMGKLKRKTRETRIAVVGASNDPEKYGNIIVKNLLGKGYAVLPVNPRETMIAGVQAYEKLADIDGPIDIVNIVTPPQVTRGILDEVAELGVESVWLQDGSFDESILDSLADAPFEAVYDACIMVVSSH